ncbi:MAG: hypothetical protein JXA60_12755 [Candidatus Coatesbacteria bacterium]|nr:hypothetical protein [Candidatus Coatesbacteria bacterium]
MNILGLTAFWHDSTAVLVQDGRITAAAEEERFTRDKHEASFPVKAASFCLKQAQGKIDRVAYYRNPYRNLFPQFMQVIKNLPKIHRTVRHQNSWIKYWFKTFSFGRHVREDLGLKDVPVDYIAHPLAHAASAFYPSGFDRALIFIADAIGEMTTTSLFLGEHGRLELVWSLDFPHSMGVLYQTFCQYLGYAQHHDEYKVMGLSAYGRDRYRHVLDTLLIPHGIDGYRLNLKYFQHPWGEKPYYNGDFIKLVGFPPRRKHEKIDECHADLACSLQEALARTVTSFLKTRAKRHKIEHLCMAGGLALNSVLNGHLLESGLFKDIFIQPASHDAGASYGAALISGLNNGVQPDRERLTSVSLGVEYSSKYVENAVKEFSNKVLLPEEGRWKPVSRLLKEGKIGGWFQGRAEFGPRALGNRSIIADPSSVNVRDRINDIIKEREYYRPLAPSILSNLAPLYFDIEPGQEFPFMLFIVKAKDKAKAEVPAVIHVDGTSRIQTVPLSDDPWCSLLLACYNEDKIPMLLNTSFNRKYEPIVNSPEDALKTFTETELDFLVMNNYLILK